MPAAAVPGGAERMPEPEPASEPLASEAVRHAIAGRCPRCGVGALFAGITRFAPACRACGLDFAGFNVGDGPAAFLILIVGAIVVALAITLELSLHPPFWVHIIWLPITLGAVLGALRIAKAMLLALEYRNAAREGRIAPPIAVPRGAKP
jgi:uncharacterized protein (DUF983 family)